MADKPYSGPNTVRAIINNIKSLFATKASVEELSANVAYINVTDNETLFTEANIQEALNTAAEEIDTLVGGDA